MFRSYFAFPALFLAALMAPSTAHAWLWGLFGDNDPDRWRMTDVDEQDRMAAPMMEKAAALVAKGKLKKAYKVYDKVWHRCPGSKYAAEAVYQMGHTSVLRKKWKPAYKAYLSLVQAYPENAHFDEMVADLFTIGAGYEDGINIHYMWFIPFRDRGKAISVYETLVSVAPYSDYSSISLLRAAMLYRNLRQHAGAADALDRIINEYPGSLETPNALLLMARYMDDTVQNAEYDQGAVTEAMNYYRDFLTLHPNNPAVKFVEEKLKTDREQYSRSRYLVGRFFYNYRDDYDSAAVFFNDSITIAPESEAATDAREYLTRIAKIKARYPNGDWPRRTSWQFLWFWNKWDPLAGLDLPEAAPAAQPAPTPEAAPAPAPAPTPAPAGPTSSTEAPVPEKVS
jgi:TolA-binding protein